MRRRLLFKLVEKNNSSSLPDIPDNPDVEINNKIYYTTTNNSTVTPYSTSVFGSTILSNSFDSSLNLYVIEFNGDVTSIGNNAFRNRSNLANVIIPNTVTSIGERAFYYCKNLASINTGDNIVSLELQLFLHVI